MRRIPLLPRLTTFLLAMTAAVLLAIAPPAGAQTLDDIASTIDQTGSYLERDLQDVAAAALSRANDRGVAFVYLDQENGDDLRIIATGLLERLDAAGSPYRSLIALDASGVYVVSTDADAAAAAADAATPEFARGAVAAGIDTVVGVLSDPGGEEAGTVDDASATGDGETIGETTSGGGVPWLLILALGVVVFLGVRFVIGRRRSAAALEAELAEDRAEIREQLRNNADHVIDLGDRIANADDELRRLYEDAAQTFQDVSLGLDDASTAAEIDALDDRLDRAEWQFEVIEARLDGRTPPPEPRDDTRSTPPVDQRPTSRPGRRQPVPPLGDDDGPRQPSGRSGRGLGDDRPALGDDESLFPGSSPQRRPRRRSGGGSGGMFGGVAKAGLLALVMRIVLGGGLGLGNTSRRTQQRRSSPGRSSRGRGSGGLGRGVLR